MGHAPWIYLFLSYPLIDFLFRTFLPIPFLSSIWDELLILLLFMFILFKRNPAPRPFPVISKPMLAFFIVGLSYLTIDMAQWGITIEGFRAVYQYILAFFIGYYLISQKEEVHKYLYFMIFLAFLIGFYGIVQKFTGVQTPQSWIDSSEGITFRAFSIVQSPNVLGAYMILMIPITLSFIFLEKNRLKQLMLLFFFLTMLGALYLTLSRGAWIALVASFAIIGSLYNRKVLFLGLGIAILAVIFVPSVNQRVSHLFSKSYMESSFKDGRVARWVSAYDRMRNDPFFGSGLGHYGGAVAKRNLQTIYVDSYYFKTLGEMGMVGLGIFFWLLYFLMKHIYLYLKRIKKPYQLLLIGGIFTGLLNVILHNAVENIFEVPFMTTFFWFLGGIALSYPFLGEGKIKEITKGVH